MRWPLRCPVLLQSGLLFIKRNHSKLDLISHFSFLLILIKLRNGAHYVEKPYTWEYRNWNKRTRTIDVENKMKTRPGWFDNVKPKNFEYNWLSWIVNPSAPSCSQKWLNIVMLSDFRYAMLHFNQHCIASSADGWSLLLAASGNKWSSPRHRVTARISINSSNWPYKVVKLRLSSQLQ